MHGEGEGRRRTASPGEQAAPATAEREREHQSIFSNQFPRNIHHSSRSKHTNPVFTYRSEVERRVVPHLSRPGGVLMRRRRRLAAVGRAWRRGVSLPWRRAVARGGRRAARGQRRPEAVPRSAVLGLGGGARGDWCGETLRAHELMDRERKRERRVVCHRRMDGVAQPNGWVDGLLFQPKSVQEVSAEQPRK